jgi:hypothetical protein
MMGRVKTDREAAMTAAARGGSALATIVLKRLA